MADGLPTMEPPRELISNVEQLRAEGYSDQDLVDYIQGFKEGYTQASPVGYAGKVANGATLGYADEVKGALRAPFTGNSRLYETARARGQLARASKDAPGVSTALEVGGSLVPGLALSLIHI